MSRTDVHAPAWVKERDPGWRHEMREEHNHTWHRVGWKHEPLRWIPIYAKVTRCDLADFLAGAKDTACQMRYAGPRNVYCGCRMCTGHLYNQQERRRSRHEAKRLCRDELKSAR